MRAPWWMIGAMLVATAPLLHADGGDDRNHGPGGQGEGQGDHQAQGNGQGQPQPQAQVQQRFPTAGAVGGGNGSRPAKRAAPHKRAPRPNASRPSSAPRPAPGAAAGSAGSSANNASHIQKQPHHQRAAAKPRAQAGPTSNIPGVGANHPAKPDQGAERAAGRQKLASLGVRAAPPRMDQSKMVRSSGGQSRVSPPSHGPDNRALPQKQVDLRHFSGAGMGARMQGRSSRPRMAAFGRMNAQESEPGHYYWHDDGGQRYCHYMDPWGYQWYGWYGDDDVLWVRYYGDRWWNYDADMGRWLYWDDGQWWWQDDDGGGVYVYVDGGYVLD